MGFTGDILAILLAFGVQRKGSADWKKMKGEGKIKVQSMLGGFFSNHKMQIKKN